MLYQLKSYIEKNKLKSGDKLPSERELSEQLNVGRSSIREALRAMELLGLIETRRGEGTFMKAYRPYYMVELLSNFLLNESRTKSELLTAKHMLEKEALFLLAGTLSENQLCRVSQILNIHEKKQKHHEVFHYLFELCNQNLLLSMWQFISGFAHTTYELEYDEQWYEKLVHVLDEGTSLDVMDLYNSNT
nr:GntR family transcriptional regulator [Halobacillus yeomjeoni]